MRGRIVGMLNSRKALYTLPIYIVTFFLISLTIGEVAASDGTSDRSEHLRGTFGTFAGESRLPNRHVDVQKLISEVADLRANTYHWLIWHAATDWDDLK